MQRAYLLAPTLRRRDTRWTHTCPNCGGALAVTFRARAYAIWLCVLGAAAILIGLSYGSVAFSFALTSALILPLVLSMQLKKAK
jgi:ABC-type uncharacterized transport system permease subunit